MNNRRNLLVVFGVAPFVPRSVFGQTRKLPIVIGWLSTQSADPSSRNLPDFKAALAALGHKDGRDVVIETRWGGPIAPDAMRQLAVELMARKPAVILTYTRRATQAAASAAPSVPIVQAHGGSPVEIGLAANLARPGGSVTGLTNLSIELAEKHTEILVDVMPNLRRIGYLVDATPDPRVRSTTIEHAQRAAERFKLKAIFADVRKAVEFEVAFMQFRNNNVQAIVVLPESWFASERHRIIRFAIDNKLPVVAGSARYTEAGALISYNFDVSYNFRRAAWYVDQILKGARPGDLPIEQPSKFEFTVNLKSAKALGLTIPPSVMVRADRVIQ